MAWKKGQSGNVSGQSAEALSGIRHLRRLFAGSVRDITLEDVKSLFRDKNGNIVRSFFIEYLKILTHYWPDGFVDPDAKPIPKEVSIKVEVVGPAGQPIHKKEQSVVQLVTSTIKVDV